LGQRESARKRAFPSESKGKANKKYPSKEMMTLRHEMEKQERKYLTQKRRRIPTFLRQVCVLLDKDSEIITLEKDP